MKPGPSPPLEFTAKSDSAKKQEDYMVYFSGEMIQQSENFPIKIFQ